jgi:T-complex protein 1 subunit delta
VDLSAAQDIEAGDGTTSVVVLAGSFLGAAEKMLGKGANFFLSKCFARIQRKRDAGIHPSLIATSFLNASKKAVEYLTEMSTPVDLKDNASLLRAATTSLNSKIVSQYSSTLAPIAVQAVTRISNSQSSNVDLRDIRIVKKVSMSIFWRLLLRFVTIVVDRLAERLRIHSSWKGVYLTKIWSLHTGVRLPSNKPKLVSSSSS